LTTGADYFENIAGYFIRRKELDDIIEKLKKLDNQVHEKFCEITVDTINLEQCNEAGVSTKVTPEAAPEGYCKELETIQ
jgi:hypothetical protein